MKSSPEKVKTLWDDGWLKLLVVIIIIIGSITTISVIYVYRQSEITTEKTFIAISSTVSRDFVFNYEKTTVQAFSTGEKSSYLEYWGNHTEFLSWHRYKVTYHLQWKYAEFIGEIIKIEDLGAVPIPKEME